MFHLLCMYTATWLFCWALFAILQFINNCRNCSIFKKKFFLWSLLPSMNNNYFFLPLLYAYLVLFNNFTFSFFFYSHNLYISEVFTMKFPPNNFLKLKCSPFVCMYAEPFAIKINNLLIIITLLFFIPCLHCSKYFSIIIIIITFLLFLSLW